MSRLKVDEVVDAVVKMHQSIERSARKSIKVKLAIYMEYSYYCELKSEISGEVSRPAHTLLMTDSIMGHPVWPVVPRYDSVSRVLHPPFTIVNVTESG